MKNWILISLLLIVSTAACRKETPFVKASKTYVESELGKLAPVTLTQDISYMPLQEIQVIKLLVKASKQIDQAFLIQVYEKNQAIYEYLKTDTDPDAKLYLDFFNIMFGPWNRLSKDHPFIGKMAKPAGANFYPADMTKKDFENWIRNHPEDQAAFESSFTMIRKQDRLLKAIPYSEFFTGQIQPIVSLLNQAADLTSDPSLATFLKSRAQSFLTDDYYQSDMDWMDLNGHIEVVIGPYEVYEDNLFGYKAAYESFVCVVDHQESEQLAEISKTLSRLEAALPIDQIYKRGESSPIKVVNLLFSAGDTKAGVQTSAFNLPNDERVRNAKGSKKVMLKNVMRAKYDKCWIPIVEKALAPEELANVSFDAYFLHVVMHEISHGLGPGEIVIEGRQTTVNKELKDLYPTIEEAKADVLGVFTAQLLIDWNIFPKSLEKTLYASNLGGMFRSIRFGTDSAHGGGVAIQMNYYLDAGAFSLDRQGRFQVDDRRMKEAVKNLAEKLLIIEAEGDYEAARELIEQLSVVRPETQAILDKLKDIPIDIRPVYPIENEI